MKVGQPPSNSLLPQPPQPRVHTHIALTDKPLNTSENVVLESSIPKTIEIFETNLNGPNNYSDLFETSSLSIEKFGSLDYLTYAWQNLTVRSGSKIKIPKGGIVPVVRVPVQDPNIEKSFCSRLFNHNRSTSKILLNNVFGIIRPGELVAIMGASGSGKTTLLNAMTCSNPGKLHIEGQFFLNGVKVDPKSITSLSAYIQQDDAFIGSMTVREHLVFHSYVRMDKHIPPEERIERINDIMAVLGLTKCANVIIGTPGIIKGISGGERKKLAFASEVLTDPKLMFCDEPTSGLDSYSAHNLVSVLNKLSVQGRTIICTIHQPSSFVFNMFNRVLLLAEGRVAFFGTPKLALKFFDKVGFTMPTNHYNPSDFFIDTLAIRSSIEESQQSATKICNAFEFSSLALKIKKDILTKLDTWVGTEKELEEAINNRIKSPYKATWYAQFKAVIWRTSIAYIRDMWPIIFLFLQTVGPGLLIGMVFYHQKINTRKGIQNIHGCFFLCLNLITFQYALAVLDNFSSEQIVFYREHFNGMYRVDVYFICKTIIGLPALLIFPMLFTAIIYYLVGFSTDYIKFIETIIIFILVANAGASFGFLVSAIAPSVSVAIVIGPALIMPLMIFGGFFINSSSTPFYLRWIHSISWFYYGFRALEIIQWEGTENGEVILSSIDIKLKQFPFNMGMLAVLCVVYRIIAFCFLLLKCHRTK